MLNKLFNYKDDREKKALYFSTKVRRKTWSWKKTKFRHLPNTNFSGLSDSLYGLNLIKFTLSFKHLTEFPKERIENSMKAISSQRFLRYLELNYQYTTMGDFYNRSVYRYYQKS